jgi:hypothetical protein
MHGRETGAAGEGSGKKVNEKRGGFFVSPEPLTQTFIYRQIVGFARGLTPSRVRRAVYPHG